MHERIKKFEDILETELKKELDRIIAAGTLNPNDVKTTMDAICLMIKTKEYEAMENEGEYSYNNGDYSTRRGRSSVTGRYVSRDVDPMMNSQRRMTHDMYSGRRSYDYGYSGHSIKDRAIAKLESMYDEAQTDHERQILDEFINRIETGR